MHTRTDLNIDGFIDNIISSYENRVQKIQTAFQSSETITESSHNLFDHVHHSLSDLKKERELLNARICESLAKNGSLRKKDYNNLMSGIISTLDEKEKAAEDLFLSFIEAQKETAQSLKNSLLQMKDLSGSDSGGTITKIKEQLSQITKMQELRKEVVISTFLDFQQMHNRMVQCLESILEKGEHLLVKDLKNILIKV
jgi:hypothetical protein